MKSYTSVILGVTAVKVDVEVDISPGMSNYTVVGLPGSSVKESRDRIKTAMRNSGFSFPERRITINLAPADIKKEGGFLDLPVAAALLAASGQVSMEKTERFLITGELSLDGSIKPVRGIVTQAHLAVKLGLEGIILPSKNFFQASIIPGIKLVPVSSLTELCGFFNSDEEKGAPLSLSKRSRHHPAPPAHGDISDVIGQGAAKRALEIAAAGGHNLILLGPPGTGKTMLAERITTILPPPDERELIEINEIHSLRSSEAPRGVFTERPFRAPHHSISYAGMIGGGNPPNPGEVTLAHNGVLFLDEYPEFRRDVVEALRQPLESGRVLITRSRYSFSFPAKFSLIATTNPCSCGNYGYQRKICICRDADLHRYWKKLTGPVMDRIDMQVEMLPPRNADIIHTRSGDGDTSEMVRKRVLEARERQRQSLLAYKISTNSLIPSNIFDEALKMTPQGEKLLISALKKLNLTARAVHRIMKIGRTIADLDGEDRVLSRHIAESINYRILDRRDRTP